MSKIKGINAIRRSLITSKSNLSHDILLYTYLIKNHHHLRRHFSSSSSNSINTIKRRRRNPRAQPTKQDKRIAHIQQNIEHKSSLKKRNQRNQIINDVIHKPLKPLTDIVTSEKFQSKIIEKVTQFQKQAQEHLLPESLKHARPSHEERFRHAIVMDNKWWAWNIALSCLPAVLVALICEYHKDEAKEYFERMNNEISKGGGGNSNQNFKKITVDDNDDDEKGTMDKVKEAVKLALFGIQPELLSNDESINNLNASHNTSQQAIIPPSNEKIDNHESSQRNTHHSSIQKINDNDGLNKNEDQSINELLNRIKALEEKLGIENTDHHLSHGRSMNDNNSSESIRINDRIPQSNIRRRIEARNGKNLREYDKISKKQQYQQEQQEILSNEGTDDEINKPQEIKWKMMFQKLVDEKWNELYDKVLNTILLRMVAKTDDTQTIQEEDTGIISNGELELINEEVRDEKVSPPSNDSINDNVQTCTKDEDTKDDIPFDAKKQNGVLKRIYAIAKILNRKGNDE